MRVRAEDSVTADDAVDELFRVSGQRVVRLAYLLTGSTAVAEEVAQEAFVRLWNAWDGVRDHDAAYGYLRTTVVNLSRSFLRRRTLEVRHLIKHGDDVIEIDVAARMGALRTRIIEDLGSRSDARRRALAVATAAVLVALIGIAASVIAGDGSSYAPAAPRDDSLSFAAVPGRPDVRIVRPAPGLPREVAAYSGVWQGVWDGRLASRLTVEKIDKASAPVVYAWAPLPDNTPAGWRRLKADVRPGGLLVLGTDVALFVRRPPVATRTATRARR